MMTFNIKDLKKIYIPPSDSHKGENGKLLIIGGSRLFHAASMWALEVASCIVDLVHYSSIPENNEIVKKSKERFRNGIVVRRTDILEYIEEDDCILIGPGMVRAGDAEISNFEFRISNLKEAEKIKNEGLQTAVLTNYLLSKYPQKRWVIDAGALQTLDPRLIPDNAILTPHKSEFERLERNCCIAKLINCEKNQKSIEERARELARKLRCIILLKGQIDMVYSQADCRIIEGGNSGMTKGGTGDVLAGLVAALACKNEPFLSAIAASFINKKAGDALYKKVGPYFNASDLAEEIPKTMHDIFNHL